MAPSLSHVQLNVIAPVRGTRPNVGRKPVTPQRMIGDDDRSLRLAADCKAYEARRNRRPGPALEPERPFLQQPWIHRLAAEPDVIQRQRAETQLRDQHRTGFIEALGDRASCSGTRLR